MRLLSQLDPEWRVLDANLVVRRNNHGHDLIVEMAEEPSRKLSLSIKGCSYLEMTQFKMPTDRTRGAWKFDLLILVDAGITLDRLGRFPEITTPRKDTVDFYVMSNAEVDEEANLGRRAGKGDVYIYRWWAPRRLGSKEAIHQVRDIGSYRSNFATIERALAKL